LLALGQSSRKMHPQCIYMIADAITNSLDRIIFSFIILLIKLLKSLFLRVETLLGKNFD